MKELSNIGKHRKARIWINEESYANIKKGFELVKIYQASNHIKWYKQSVGVEISLPRNNSNYAILGASFIPKKNSNNFVVKVICNEVNEKIRNNTLAMEIEEVFLGLTLEYSQAIMNSTGKLLDVSSNLPEGELIFNIGGYGKIGSSIGLFSVLTKVILELIQLDLVKLDTVDIEEKICENLKF